MLEQKLTIEKDSRCIKPREMHMTKMNKESH